MTAFVAVVGASSFTRAAQSLGVSKSVVSRRISGIESRIGMRLIDRSSARVGPTEAGSAYYLKCLSILEAIEEANHQIASWNSGLRGTIVVCVSSSLCVPAVTRSIAEFARAYSDIKLKVDIEERDSSVREARFDIAIRNGQSVDSSMAARVIGHSTHTLCASPAYLEMNGTPTSADMLKDHEGLMHARGHVGTYWLLRDGAQLRSFRIPERMRSECVFHLIEAAKADLGIVQLPDYLVADALRNGALVALLPQCSPPPDPISLVYPVSRKASQKVRLLVEYLAERMQGALSQDTRADVSAEAADGCDAPTKPEKQGLSPKR
ncbi:LysR family transcriptional regulator [Lysobacter antibioticus]|nr:LysR family transcriptional regulator [Lysobacter antibioticus]